VAAAEVDLDVVVVEALIFGPCGHLMFQLCRPSGRKTGEFKMEVLHDAGFFRNLAQAHDAKADKNIGSEYRVEKTNAGWKVTGQAMSKPSHFLTEDRAMALARHLVGPKGGAITRVSNGKRTRQRVAPHLNYTPSGNQRDIELEEYDGNFPFPVPAELRQALLEWIEKRDQEIVRRATDALLKAGYHR
jgi:hypothetical protein